MHSLVFVIVPTSAKNIADEVSHLMLGSEAEPNKQYPTYERPCICIGQAALWESFEQLDSSPEGIELTTQISFARQVHNKELEDAAVMSRATIAHQLEVNHPKYQKVDADCDICRGTGVSTLSRDPRQNWDFWSIGGRWHGLFNEYALVSPNLDKNMNSNIARVNAVPDSLQSAAIVTPEGHWHEGSIQLSDQFQKLERDNEKQARLVWTNEARSIMKQYSDYYVVVVDSHS